MTTLLTLEHWSFNMEYVFATFVAMSIVILSLLKTNKDLKSETKLKDLEIEDKKLEKDQEFIKKKKSELKKQMPKKPKKKPLTDEEIESHWKKKKVKK